MRKVKLSEGEYYHIYNRGVDRRKTFLDDRDYERFISNLFLANSSKKFEMSKNKDKKWSLEKSLSEERGDRVVAIGAYCLMPNHFHLLVKEITPGGISKFMQKVQNAYTGYFNKKVHRTGVLFEGAFKAEHVDDDRYLKYLFAYIHLNPIGIIESGWKKKEISDYKKAQDFLESYKLSSMFDYQDKERDESVILDRDVFPEYFKSGTEFNSMIKEWLYFNKEDIL